MGIRVLPYTNRNGERMKRPLDPLEWFVTVLAVITIAYFLGHLVVAISV